MYMCVCICIKPAQAIELAKQQQPALVVLPGTVVRQTVNKLNKQSYKQIYTTN